MENDSADLGFEREEPQEKTRRVGEVFSSVASRYDLMNDLMSFGVHRLWKRYAIHVAQIKSGAKILDVAGGTGDMSVLFHRAAGEKGSVIVSDINNAMLSEGRDRLLDRGLSSGFQFVQANAEALPFQKNSFNCLSIGFGLRNVTDKAMALRSMYDVLKPGGKVLILEFSKPTNPLLNKIYDKYSFNVIPKVGGLVADDQASYQYLVESIRMHPGQQEMLGMLNDAGFED